MRLLFSKMYSGITVQLPPSVAVTFHSNLRCIRQGSHTWLYFCILWGSSVYNFIPWIDSEKFMQGKKKWTTSGGKSKKGAMGLQSVHLSFTNLKGREAVLGQHCLQMCIIWVKNLTKPPYAKPSSSHRDQTSHKQEPKSTKATPMRDIPWGLAMALGAQAWGLLWAPGWSRADMDCKHRARVRKARKPLCCQAIHNPYKVGV